MNQMEQQIIALAGLFQAMEAVDQLARNGHCDSQILETAVRSLFVSDPDTALDVFDNLQHLKSGLEKVCTLLSKQSANKQLDSVRYALAIIHLENKLRKDSDMLATIGQRIEKAALQVQHFGYLHENVLEGLAATYLDTISTFKIRVHVAGEPGHLQVALNAAKIRVLLFAGIRAATLWRQVGGHRWHFIFKRSTLTKQAEQLLAQLKLH